MPFKYLDFAPHAKERMDQRGFTSADVRFLVETYPRERAWTPVGAEQRWQSVGFLPRLRTNREVGVVYLENAVRYLIITVEWMD